MWVVFELTVLISIVVIVSHGLLLSLASNPARDGEVASVGGDEGVLVVYVLVVLVSIWLWLLFVLLSRWTWLSSLVVGVVVVMVVVMVVVVFVVLVMVLVVIMVVVMASCS